MGKYRIMLDGNVYEIEIEKIDDAGSADRAVSWSREPAAGNTSVQIIDPAATRKTVDDGNIVYSPMPGTVLKILLKNGSRVEKGEPVLILEAMKMENEICAQMSGTINGLDLVEKQSVQGGEMLFSII